MSPVRPMREIHDAGDRDTNALVVGDRRLQKVDSAGGLFVRLDLRESHSRGVVDADMDELPADAAALALAGAIAGDPVADPLEAPEFLDVDVDNLAGVLALVAFDRLGWLEIAQAVETGAFEHAAHCRRADARNLGDMLSGEAMAA